MIRVFAAWLFFSLYGFCEPVPFAVAITEKRVAASMSGNGRDSAVIHLTNPADVALELLVPAGSILVAENGEKQIVLRDLRARIDPKSEADAVLPTAALSSKNSGTQRGLSLSAEQEPRLAKVLALFVKQNDLPRPTAQFAIFVILEDITWDVWMKWLSGTRPAGKEKQPISPAEVAQAVDGLALVKLTNPERPPTMLADDAMKRLALRNPWARGKAMALYGMTVENALTGDPALPPDLNQLLHTAPNDNCPICKQRQKLQPEFP